MSSAGYHAPPFKHTQMTLERIDKFISTTYFSDVNLQSKLITKNVEPTELLHFKAEGRFDFGIAKNAEYKPIKLGDAIGPLWSTHWFRVKFEVSEAFVGALTERDEVLFYWDTCTEATIWDEKGEAPVGAFSCAEPHGNVRETYPVTGRLKASNRLEFLIEVACNKVLGEGAGLFIGPPDKNATYSLRKCCLFVRNTAVRDLLRDLKILHDIAKELADQERGIVALYTANEMVNVIQSEAPDSYERTLALSREYFSQHNGSGQHVIHAVGHCHMDCAWLWPYDETKRKCARSWSATLDLMDRYPDWTFACSSAQQYEWVQVNYPNLFTRLKEYVKRGRFIPVGGSWVEMDGYLPSGESMCRQLLFGQRYFKKEFDMQCTEFWLPDTFGYSAQLPQIMTHFGMERFFTQKISWSLFNKFPHHTFFWKGVDGTSVLSHFAPGDSYHMQVNVDELTKTINNFQDKGRSSRSLFLFGHGDGGQGPTEDMLENLDRLKDVNGLPRVELSTPDIFFRGIENKELQNLCTWSGELYLEMHNGTYTTQAELKRNNRICESMLHNVEFLATLCYISGLEEYPFNQLDSLWKKVLLNQFHDVLPGSSIEIVNNEVSKMYREVMKEGWEMLSSRLSLLCDYKCSDSALTVCNTLGWPRTELLSVDLDVASKPIEQEDPTGNAYQLVTIEGFSVMPSSLASRVADVTVERANFEFGDVIILSNSKVYATIDRAGRVEVLQSQQAGNTTGRNFIAGLANQFTLYNDIPLFWDAWDVMDYHQETRKELNDVISGAMVREEGPLRASVEVSIKISDRSYIKQTIILDADSPYLRVDCEVNWHENRKFLKVEFPLGVVSDHVTYETQFGHIRRPTHLNTSWDSAKYEVCSQKWMDLSDYTGGVAILNNCKYGCSVTNHSTLSLSLLRSPKYPDANADMGFHRISYAMMPHAGSFQEAGVIRSAQNFNTPLITGKEPAITVTRRLFSADQPSLVIDTVKVAESDRENRAEDGKCVILRCYEAFGGSCNAIISSAHPLKSVYFCDGLENELEEISLIDSVSFQVILMPYQICTIKLVFP